MKKHILTLAAVLLASSMTLNLAACGAAGSVPGFSSDWLSPDVPASCSSSRFSSAVESGLPSAPVPGVLFSRGMTITPPALLGVGLVPGLASGLVSGLVSGLALGLASGLASGLPAGEAEVSGVGEASVPGVCSASVFSPAVRRAVRPSTSSFSASRLRTAWARASSFSCRSFSACSISAFRRSISALRASASISSRSSR